MRETIVIGHKQREEIFFSLGNERNFYFADSEKSAYLHHLENPDVDSYLLDFSLGDEAILASIIERIHYLNALVNVLISVKKEGMYRRLEKLPSVRVLSDPQHILDHFKDLPVNKRKYNRVYWPVEVRFKTVEKPRQRGKGNLLSISSGGCFVRTDEIFEKEALLELYIFFKDFNFQTQGKVVRLQSGGAPDQQGIALEFQGVSLQTSRCIQSIIDERILNSIMKKMSVGKLEG